MNTCSCFQYGKAFSMTLAAALLVATVFNSASASTNTGSWAIVSSPNVGGAVAYNTLYGVACASTSDCWAVGYAEAQAGSVTHTLIEHWDGTAYSGEAGPAFRFMPGHRSGACRAGE